MQREVFMHQFSNSSQNSDNLNSAKFNKQNEIDLNIANSYKREEVNAESKIKELYLKKQKEIKEFLKLKKISQFIAKPKNNS